MHSLKKTSLIIWAALIAALIVLCTFNSCKEENSNTKIGYLNGPTGISLVQMPSEEYSFNKYSTPDTLVSEFATGKIDIALIPANVASALYNKTEGKISVIDINTLGVVQLISQDKTIDNYYGKTFYSTGKGTIVESLIQIFLRAYNMTENDINLEYKSDAAEVITYIQNNPKAIGILNEPQASLCLENNSNFKKIDSAQNMWKEIFGNDGDLLTGVTVVSSDYLKKNRTKIIKFLNNHKHSIELINNDYNQSAKLLNDINPDQNLKFSAESIKNSNLTYIDGLKMKNNLSKFLKIIYDNNPELVGGKLPDDNFYFIDE